MYVMLELFCPQFLHLYVWKWVRVGWSQVALCSKQSSETLTQLSLKAPPLVTRYPATWQGLVCSIFAGWKVDPLFQRCWWRRWWWRGIGTGVVWCGVVWCGVRLTYVKLLYSECPASFSVPWNVLYSHTVQTKTDILISHIKLSDAL